MREAASGAPRYASGKIRCNVEGASPTSRATLLPVFRLGSVLIAGDHSPLGEIDSRAGQKDPRQPEASLSAHIDERLSA